ncbi:type I restriction-modification system subunit M [Candidatus Pelagibacter sp.]|nr:type I restriction-modification system subunit M [Candidatus Pelagibacter sp.]
MIKIQKFKQETMKLIDDLKSVCANYGLGNDGNEFKIITQVFLFKFLNDKFIYDVKKLNPKMANSENFYKTLSSYSDDDYEMLTMQLGENTAQIRPKYSITSLFSRQNEANFAELFDETLLGVAKDNSGIFSAVTDGGEKIVLFENISKYVTDNRDEFCKALTNKIVGFSFEHIFEEKFDFYADIFEYLIKDYNSNSGGKYAEYFTPHAVAKIMARCLVNQQVKNATCFDPSAGSGTLLMNLAHEIGEDKCTIYAQDISQKSSTLLRLNLILNDLIHSIPNIVKGNTIKDPYHKSSNGKLNKFDYIVSNPPFKLDFSDYRNELENSDRFFAGVPNIPAKKKESMAIYLLFIQHIIHSLSDIGKAAIVVPTGFITAQSGIDKKIRKKLVDEKILSGVVSMPSNIFATTGTNVSIVFLDKENKSDVILIDASNLGTKIKEGKYQKTLLSEDDENKIINTFTKKDSLEDFSITVSYKDIAAKNYSFSAGQFFDVKIDYFNISSKDFSNEMKSFSKEIEKLFDKSKKSDNEIKSELKKLKFESK